jgi:hypothetical protein
MGVKVKMSNERFGLFVLSGPIFDGVGMPVEAAAELLAYKALVLDVAKKLYLQQNPHRERSRRNLASEFDLRLEKVEQGSADVILLHAKPDTLFPVDLGNDIFAHSRDVVTQTIQSVATSGTLPSIFPLRSLPKFRAFGKTFPVGHSVRVGSLDGRYTATLDLNIRQRFLELLDADSTQVQQEAAGTMVELDPERLVFHLRTSDGERVQCDYGDLSTIDRSLLADETGDGPLVSVKGEALVGRDGVLQRFVSVEAVHTVTQPSRKALDERLSYIEGLDDGWLDADSKAVLPDVMASAKEALNKVKKLPDGFTPAPLPDGGLRFEWAQGSTEYVAEIESDGGLYLCLLPESSENDDEKQLDTFDLESFVNFVEDGELD